MREGETGVGRLAKRVGRVLRCVRGGARAPSTARRAHTGALVDLTGRRDWDGWGAGTGGERGRVAHIAEAERDSAVDSLKRITQKYNDLKRMRNIKRVTFVGSA